MMFSERDRAVQQLLDWALEGEPLTSEAERELHAELAEERMGYVPTDVLDEAMAA